MKLSGPLEEEGCHSLQLRQDALHPLVQIRCGHP